MENLPIYKIVFDEEKGDTVSMVSLVDFPAIEENFLKFSSELEFQAKNEMEQILTGAVMIPNKMIYRRWKDQEFYVTFDEQTIRKMRDSFFKNNQNGNINLNHSEPTSGNYVVESWIIEDFETDKSKALGFKELPKGTLMFSVKVTDSDFWNKEIMSGNYKGFSLEMVADLEPIAMQKIEEETLQLLNEIEEKISIELEVQAGRIRKAMEDKRVIKIYYEGSYDGNETINAGYRDIEIFTYGLTLRANRVVRAWQRGGATDSSPEGWKLFLTKKISNWTPTIQKYTGTNRPDYNPNDKGMITIFQSI